MASPSLITIWLKPVKTMDGLVYKIKMMKTLLLCACLVTVLLYSSCTKDKIICLECNAPIIRVYYFKPGDTIIQDLSMQAPLPPADSDFNVINGGFSRQVDTLWNSMIQYKVCYDY